MPSRRFWPAGDCVGNGLLNVDQGECWYQQKVHTRTKGWYWSFVQSPWQQNDLPDWVPQKLFEVQLGVWNLSCVDASTCLFPNKVPLSTALLILLVSVMGGNYILENPYQSFMFDYVFLRKVWRMLKKAHIKVGILKLGMAGIHVHLIFVSKMNI